MCVNVTSLFNLRLHRLYSGKVLFFVSLLFTLMLIFPCFTSVSLFVSGVPTKVVHNETELVTAVNNAAEPTVILLGNDVKLSGSLSISAHKDITLTSNSEKGFFKLIGENNESTIMVNDTGVLTLAGIIVTHNAGSMGRGVTVNSGGKLVLSDGEISGNNATMGGGVYMSYSTFNMTGGAITNNVASTGDQIDSSHVVTQHSGTLHNAGGNGPNTATGAGGGVYVGYDGSFSMSGGVIANSTVDLDGGGVFVDAAGSFSMSDNSVVANNKAARHGGGVYANVGSFRITGNARVTNNTTTHRGGGVHMNFSSFSMSGGMINNNTAGSGGGMYMNLGSVSIMTGGEISDNIAIGAQNISGGGGVYNEGNFALYGGVVTNNVAKNFGGGVYDNADFKLFGEGEVYGNTAQRGDNVYRVNISIETYVILIVSVVLVIGVVGGLFFFKNKRNQRKKSVY
jgi:hypothetical protein